MANFKRRFTKEEFQKELFTHLKDMPPGYLRAHDKLEQITQWKADHYSTALAALDSAAERLKKLAESHPDAAARQEAESGVKEINEAIDAYGEASLSGNSVWNPIWNSES